MKHGIRIISTFVVSLFSFSGFAQTSPITVVFEEKFDPPSGPDSVTTFHTTPGTNVPYWNDTSAFSISAPNSYHAKIVPFDSIIFQTDTFSTVGNVFVSLTFDQICKVHFGQHAYIRVSNDNGASWTRLNGSHYSGASPAFPTAGYFNELSFDNPNGTPYWGGLTTAGTGTAPSASWWVGETFDISSIIGNGPSGTANGYQNCLIQFILEYKSPFGTADPAGWFVDNLKVKAAPCELVPPTIDFNLNPKREPIGLRYQTFQQIRLKARDPGSGIDSVVLFHRLNNGPWDTVQMASSISTACPDSAEYYYNLTNLIVGDSVDWYVEVFDCTACLNMDRAPSLNSGIPYNTFWIGPSSPAICGITTPTSFPYLVTNFPWIENFSSINWIQGSGVGGIGTSHRGVFPQGNPPSGKNWGVSPNTNSTGFAWSVRVGQTGTPNTGPLGDHTTGTGKYLYTEASQGNTNNNTLVYTPCIKLTGLNHAVLEFWYHKYGQNMGNMRVDIDTGSAFPSWVNLIAWIPGQVQTSQTQPWEKMLVNLDPYLGKIIRVRFLGNKNNTSSNDLGDMAIDDISIYEPDPVSVNGLSSFCTGDSVTLTANGGQTYLWNTGDTSTSITVNQGGAYYVIGTSSSGFVDTSSIFNISILPGPDTSVTASGPLAFCNGNSVTLTAASGQSYLWSNGDTNQSITINQAGSYYAEVISSNGCSDTTNTFITSIISVLDTSVTVNGSLGFCNGGSVTLTGVAGQSYLWNTGDTSQSIIISQSGSYYAVLSSTNGCFDTTSTYVTSIYSNADTSLSVSQNILCNGDSAVLTAVAGQNYLWNNGSTSNEIVIYNSGNYYVTITTNDGCVGTSDTINISAVSTQISGPQSCPPGAVRGYSTNANAISTYLWSVLGGNISNGQGTNSITVLWGNGPTGVIGVVESNGGCQGFDTLLVSVSGVGLDDNSLNSIILSPNPNSGLFSIQVNQEHIGSSYQILDNLGRLIDKGVIRELSQDFDLSDKPKGVYRIQVSNDKAIKTLNVVIQ